jgi:iron-sulfur cluster repair protein YtfE (RIC family)
MSDVTRILEQDHRKVEQLFEQIKKQQGAVRANLVEQLAADLRTHMRVEESIVYPFIVKQLNGDGKEMVEEAKTEHEGARKVLAEVERLSPNEPGFDGAFEMLEAGISHHVEEEETEVFPKLRKSASAAQLNEVGEQVEEAKGNAALENMSRDELYQRAQDADIPGRSSMTKDELVAALAARS